MPKTKVLRSRKSETKLPPGMYAGISVKALRVNKEGQIQLRLDFSQAKKLDTKVTIPEEGHIKFYVHCDRLSIYTTIGANNIHHASNKVNKLYGPNWSKITRDEGYGKAHSWVCGSDFSELLKTLQI